MSTGGRDSAPFKVLVVDDEIALLRAYERTLASTGYDVARASTAEEAIRVANDWAPDVVVLDSMLPDGNGIDVCRRMKADRPTTFVILISGVRRSADEQVTGLDAGADGYITKPIEPRALVAHVRALLRIKESEKNLRAVAEQLAESNRRLEEYNRLKAEFVANMSHELRTPLNAIIGFAQLMSMRTGEERLPDRFVDGVNRILRNSRHLLALIDGVLDLSKIEAGHQVVFPEHFDVAEVVQAAFGELQSLARQKHLEYRLVVRDTMPLAYSDPLRIRQVVINLLSNAIKFTADGFVQAEVSRFDETHWRLVVRDSGIGIRRDQLDLIFERFRQIDGSTTREAGGAGLGLSIVQELVKKLGGTIRVDSTYGDGSAFTVVLPFSIPSQRDDTPVVDPQAAAAPLVDDGGDPESPLALVIEDDEDHAAVVESTLTAAGYRVVIGRDGAAGLQLVRQLLPAAVVLDIMMPSVDGWRVLQAMKADARTADIPVIVCSIVDNRALGYQLGASEYLLKPVEPGRLLESLENVGASANDGEGGFVLVVDDEKSVRDLLTTALRHAGFDVRAASGGEAALKLVAKASPRAVLCDLIMPGGMSGFELIARLRANPTTESVPIVVITGKDLRPADRRLMSGQIADVIRKGDLLLPDLDARLQAALEHFGVRPTNGDNPPH
jgi:DNA-binding response OmpR family regulator